MIPKIDFQIHDALVRTFLFPPTNDAQKGFKKQAGAFMDFFNKNSDKTLKSIQKFSGYKWAKDRIPVYLIPNAQILSFTKSILEDDLPGVVQKVFPNQKRTAHIFIHELVHVNQWQSKFVNKNQPYNESGDEFKRELYADLICLHVLRDIFGKNSEHEKDFWDFLQNTTERNKKKLEGLKKITNKWDLIKKPLKEYL